MFASAFFDEMEKIAVGWGGPGSSMLQKMMPPSASPKAVSTARSGVAALTRAARRASPQEARIGHAAGKASQRAGHPGFPGPNKDAWADAVNLGRIKQRSPEAFSSMF